MFEPSSLPSDGNTSTHVASNTKETLQDVCLRNEHSLISREIYFKFHAIVQIRVLMHVGKDVKWGICLQKMLLDFGSILP